MKRLVSAAIILLVLSFILTTMFPYHGEPNKESPNEPIPYYEVWLYVTIFLSIVLVIEFCISMTKWSKIRRKKFRKKS